MLIKFQVFWKSKILIRFYQFLKDQLLVDFGVLIEIIDIQNPQYLENEEYCLRKKLICFSYVSEDGFSTIKSKIHACWQKHGKPPDLIPACRACSSADDIHNGLHYIF